MCGKNFSHSTTLDLKSAADLVLSDRLDALHDEDSLSSEMEQEVYALVHFGTSESHSTPKERPELVQKKRYKESGMLCFTCKALGHMMRDCPNASVSGCLLCGQQGHTKATCSRRVCAACGRMGHSGSGCWKTNGRSPPPCKICNRGSHYPIECPSYRNEVTVYAPRKPITRSCSICGEGGHFSSECHRDRFPNRRTFYVAPDKYNGRIQQASKEAPCNGQTNPAKKPKGRKPRHAP